MNEFVNGAIDAAEYSPDLEPSYEAEAAGDFNGNVDRPQGLPDKFWDSENNQLRIDALTNSYLQLEQKLGSSPDAAMPADASGYDIRVPEDGITSDEAVNQRLHEAGFSQQQAQLVYDLASEYLGPMVADMAADFSTKGEQEHLVSHFGGEERWREAAGQLREWGKANLPLDVFQAMSASIEGVKSMHRMMEANEPQLMRGGVPSNAVVSEDGLRALMRDPKYWRDHDPAVIERVRQGFKRLYPDDE